MAVPAAFEPDREPLAFRTTRGGTTAGLFSLLPLHCLEEIEDLGSLPDDALTFSEEPCSKSVIAVWDRLESGTEQTPRSSATLGSSKPAAKTASGSSDVGDKLDRLLAEMTKQRRGMQDLEDRMTELQTEPPRSRVKRPVARARGPVDAIGHRGEQLQTAEPLARLVGSGSSTGGRRHRGRRRERGQCDAVGAEWHCRRRQESRSTPSPGWTTPR